jgi:hypothetical protein
LQIKHIDVSIFLLNLDESSRHLSLAFSIISQVELKTIRIVGGLNFSVISVADLSAFIMAGLLAFGGF